MTGEAAHGLSRAGVFFAVALLAAGILGYEILLARLLAIVHWHHFAYMIIAVALLGFGAACSLVAVFQTPLLARFRWAFGSAALGFGAGAPLAFALAQSLPFNALEIAWDRAQLGWLFALYLVLSVPFFSAALALALAFRAHAARAGALYRMDLVGAGLGALGMVFLLDALPLADALRAVGFSGAIAGGVVLLWGKGLRPARGGALLAVCAGLALPAALPDHWLRPHPSPYKGLSLALTAPDAHIVAERHGPLGWLAAVESPRVPFRHAPGLSLMAQAGPPAQIGLFTDGGAPSAITRADADLRYLEAETAALPYHLVQHPRTLVLGAGGGAEVLRALRHGARTVDAVELNPDVLAIVRDVLAGPPGGAWEAGDVRTHVADARSFAARAAEHWDLIQIALVDSFSAAAAGVHALDESLLYTVEAFEIFLDRLAPGGVLAVTRWLKLPPRDSLRLLWTARRALEARGVADPASHLVMIRGWKTTTLVIGARPFGEDTIAGLRRFAEDYAFDLVWHPGIGEGEANRHNRLAEPEFYRGASAILGPDPEGYAARYKFALTPATDDRPFFFHTLKWSTLPELLALRAQGGLPLIEWGFVILVATLVQALVAAALLILAPLLALRTPRTTEARPPARWRVVLFFACLGLAFLFIEIAFMQRFAVFLGHPLYAIAVVLAGLLVFAGLGAGAIDWLARLAGRWPPLVIVAAGIIVVGGAYVGLLPYVFEAAQGWPTAARLAVALALLGPIGFFLGMPFPLGLKALGARAPALVPWAWGINACASVVSASLATFIALHVGFTPVLGCALVLYALAATFPPQAAEAAR
ncbi:MAG: hypothetical protein OXP75_03040 [Rhodospirillales bacterium]|nr:hypothetical protein [Rhodospirillales bacterium]